jgi:hypothetical protein
MTADRLTMFDPSELATDACTYTEPGGTAVSCHPILTKAVERVTADGLAVVRRDEVDLNSDEIAAPVRNAQIVIAGTTYIVDEIIENDGGTSTVAVHAA